ncbi:hypothetical protein AX16_010842 [Volvariella volvacea WC 439]|nr:hypothetical protein AX16_010842 [Volvariella volvacea WC 439]
MSHVSYAIYPPVGVARVGNSETESFIGPEVPGRFTEPEGGYKDANGAIKRQAARFRVYALRDRVPFEEVTSNRDYTVEWTFQLANKKPSYYRFMGRMEEGPFQPGYTRLRNPAVQPDLPPDSRDRLIIRSSTGVLEGCDAKLDEPLHGTFTGSTNEPVDVYLGDAWTDEKGRLVIVGGHGRSRSVADPNEEYPFITDDFDSPDWIDDTSDGWVSVRVKLNDGSDWVDGASKARVMVAPPDFAPGVYAPTSLYDVVEDVYEQRKRNAEGENYDVGDVEWYAHIWPLLQRPALLSWVNIQATGGHGPGGPGNFFDAKWVEVLKKTSDDVADIRQGVLGRMRLPFTNPKYDKARSGQAYPYFMPWLSGDNGRTTAGDETTFSSITQLQYDRLTKWAQGNFTVGPTPDAPPETIERLDIKDQPAALTKAALEATIGSPLYPGIESSWNMELPTTYNLDLPFTIADSLDAGDLTRYLSNPWQSDFYMCRNYWWPSVRPDAVLPEDAYLRILYDLQRNNPNVDIDPAELARQFGPDTRRPWERGLRQNYTDVYDGQPYFANTDMAQHWHLLGVVTQRPPKGYVTDTEQPIFVETQRSPVISPRPRQDEPSRPRLHVQLKFPAKLDLHGINDIIVMTLEQIQEHLQTAMLVELSTIPIYLYAMYSVKTPAQFKSDPRYYDPLVGAIRGIVAEEMLHLSLAGNMLRATGGNPVLYSAKKIPTYPSNMLGHVPKLVLNLRKLDKQNLNTFLQIEFPAQPDAPAQPDKYRTLAQFYDAIKQGMEYYETHRRDTDPPLFPPGTEDYQFAPGVGYQARWRDAGGSVVVKNLDDAKKAIDIIVEQGEGHSENDDFDDPDQLEKSHYALFSKISRDEDNGIIGLDRVYNVLDNPRAEDYRDSKIRQVAITFNAAYCFLLVTIETLWKIPKRDERHQLVLGNLYGVMMGVLAPLAKFMVKQDVGNGRVAGPTFQYYEFKVGQQTFLQQLKAEMKRSIAEYLDADRDETPDQVPIYNYGEQINLLLPIQDSINKLVELPVPE